MKNSIVNSKFNCRKEGNELQYIDINWRKTGVLFLIVTLLLTGMGPIWGAGVSHAEAQEFYVSSTGEDTNEGTEDAPFATLYKAYEVVNDGGHIYILDNITMLAGNNKSFLNLNQNKKVTITTAPGITNPAVIQRGPAGGAGTDTLFDLNQGQLTLRNIIIDGSFQDIMFKGRLINVYTAKLIIEEGTILRNNYSEFGGSAIYLNDKTAVVEMTGGEITGNRHVSSGSVLLISGATFIMTGGIITDNSGGGIDVREGGRFFLSGAASVTGNTIELSGQQLERNVNLQGSTLLNLNGAFTGEAGITAQGRMTTGSQFGEAAESGLTGLENLIADNSPLSPAYGDSNALIWQFKNLLNEPSADGEITGPRPTLKGETLPDAEVEIKFITAEDPSVVITKKATADSSGNWELTVDEDLRAGTYTIEVTASKDNVQSLKVTRELVVVNDMKGPGGIDSTNLKLWLKAGDGASQEEGKLTGWTDKSPANNILTMEGPESATPDYAESSANFNPAIKFNNPANAGHYANSSKLVGDKPITIAAGYAVYKWPVNHYGALVGSTVKNGDYGQVFLGEYQGKPVAGNGVSGVYNSINFSSNNPQFRISNYNIGGPTLADHFGSVDGKSYEILNRSITSFGPLTLTPVIGATNGAGDPNNWHGYQGTVAGNYSLR